MDDIFLDSGFEENITYTPSGGTAVTIPAVIGRDRLDETVEGRNRLNIYRYTITVSKTDVPDAKKEDQVVMPIGDGTETFRVAGILEEDQGAYTLGVR